MHMLRKKYSLQLKIQNVINLTWTTRDYYRNHYIQLIVGLQKYFRKEKRITC